MRIDLSQIQEVCAAHLNGGNGEVRAAMFFGKGYMAIRSALPAGASIGMHAHEKSFDFNFVLSGRGEAVCDGEREELSPGIVHCCPPGSSHAISNTGEEDLVLITFVPEL